MAYSGGYTTFSDTAIYFGQNSSCDLVAPLEEHITYLWNAEFWIETMDLNSRFRVQHGLRHGSTIKHGVTNIRTFVYCILTGRLMYTWVWLSRWIISYSRGLSQYQFVELNCTFPTLIIHACSCKPGWIIMTSRPDVTRMIVSKGNHRQTALEISYYLVSEWLKFSHIYIYICIYPIIQSYPP